MLSKPKLTLIILFSRPIFSICLWDTAEKHSLSLSPPLTWDLTSCLPISLYFLTPPTTVHPFGPFHPFSPLPLPISSHILSSPLSPSSPRYHLVSTFPYSLPANKGEKKLLLISGWPLPLGHILRGSTWLLTWPSAIKTRTHRPGKTRGKANVYWCFPWCVCDSSLTADRQVHELPHKLCGGSPVPRLDWGEGYLQWRWITPSLFAPRVARLQEPH